MNKTYNRKSQKQIAAERTNFLMFLLPLILLLSVLLIASLVSVAFDIGKRLNFPIITAIFSLCTFLTAFVSSNKKRKNGLITGIIYNLPSILIVLVTSVILNSFKVDLNLLLSFCTMQISSALGGVLGVNHKQKLKRGKK